MPEQATLPAAKKSPRTIKSLSSPLQVMAEIERLMAPLGERDRVTVATWFCQTYDPPED